MPEDVQKSFVPAGANAVGPRALPPYLRFAQAVPRSRRAPWYSSTFPTYFGIFLWVGFYLDLCASTLRYASVGVCILGLVAAGLVCFALYFYVPAMLGMQTGQPLYVIGAATFGATGGYAVPGLLMGVLQVGWVSVISSVAVTFILRGLGTDSQNLFATLVVIWIYSLGWIAVKGIQHVGRVAKILNWVPLVMMGIVLWANRGGLVSYAPPQPNAWKGFWGVLTIVIGYFASAGAAGADFGMNSRDRRDVVLGGLCGIVAGVVVAGGGAVLAVAGYLGRHAGPVSYSYSAAIASVGALAPIMFFLFAAASLVPTCFSSFIAANSFSTMLPSVSRTMSSFLALTASMLIAISGVAGNLVGFFGIVGASFGPICGAMVADYLLAGRRWPGPRRGIHWPGYAAWAVGFLVGMPGHIPGLPETWVQLDNPSALYALVAGFLVYLALGAAGLRPGAAASDGGMAAGEGEARRRAVAMGPGLAEHEPTDPSPV